jgi:Abortive infection C-terminus
MAETPLLTSFVMHGARAAIAAGLLHIEEQVKGIELAIDENPGLAFDLAKVLIESACRTILTEREISFEPGDDLPKIFRTTTNSLPFLPTTASGEVEVRRSLAQTLGGLQTAVQGVCELRNACGFASHGGDSPKPTLEAVQAILAAETADAIVGFLYRIHKQDRVPPPSSRQRYEEHSDFNDYVDDSHERVRVFEEDFQPSRILFDLAPEAYRLYLAEYQPEEDADGPTAAQGEVGVGLTP